MTEISLSAPMPTAEGAKSAGVRELISFRVGEQDYCVDIMAVREIRGWSPATPLPQQPPYMRGVISLRGKWRLAFVSLSIVAAVGGGLFIYQVITSPQNTRLQYLLLHGRVNVDKVEGSDAARTKSQQMAIEKLTQNPIGYGLGVVGPASQQAGRSIVTENWYLQIALELGVAGVLLFVAFWLSNIADLFATIRRLGADPLRIALLASVCGLMLSNLFLHTWADSTLAIMTFSLLGFVRRPA